MFRFRRFRSRILAMLLGLLLGAFGATYFFVSRANLRNALEQIHADLETGARVFDEATRQRIDLLATGARLMGSDYAIRTVLLADPIDSETLADTLISYSSRIGAPLIGLFKRDGDLLAHNDATLAKENLRVFAELIHDAAAQERGVHSAFAELRGELHVLVVVPLYAPFPEIHSWFGLAFPIDRAFAENIKATSRVEMTFISTEDDTKPRVLTSTLPDASAQRVASAAMARPQIIEQPNDRYVSLFKPQPLLGRAPATVVLQRALSAELAGAREMEKDLIVVSIVAFVFTTVVALWIASGVSKPVLELAGHTRFIAAGDYERRIDLRREDELGHLARAFNTMSAGLAERDRVRDLLDKNVSPEVAAQLLRDGAALGGEEREVTILFADLRGFTTLSEQFAPRELLTLLNRYLDRMSREIERQGGVIDKFIGDAIMALFGAPMTQNDAPDRALAAAVAMERALAELNRELVTENRAPLTLGIGVNTARVIAGNIGSHRRLNYSVIGDGVNVAARLQSETRKPEFGANIITTAATLAALRDPKTFRSRPLGPVRVKGRNEPVEIFAIDNMA